MSVNSVNPYYSLMAASNSQAADTSSNSSKTSSTGFDMSDFFKIIAAELENQTMDSTVDSSQYVSQMVEISSMEQMNKMASTFSSSLAVSLLGKTVMAVSTDTSGKTTQKTGVVSGVDFSEDTPSVVIDGQYYGMDSIVAIKQT